MSCERNTQYLAHASQSFFDSIGAAEKFLGVRALWRKDEDHMFEEEPKKQTNWGPIAAAIVTAIGGILVVYVQFVVPKKLEIQTTQTAEARLSQPVPTFLVEPASPTKEADTPPPATETPVPPTATVFVSPDVFDTDKIAGLKPYNSPGASISFAIVPSFSGDGLQISYKLEAERWAGVYRLVELGSLQNTRGVRFSYMGNGAANTLEFKMEYKQGTVFSVVFPHASAAPDWQEMEILYTDLTCWFNTPGCPESLSLNLEPDKVIKIGFAISNKSYYSDEPGEGKVILDDVRLIR